jgi:hypothetical protein
LTARVVPDTDATVPRIIVVALVALAALSGVATLPFAALESLGREPFPMQPANTAKRAVTPIRRQAEMLEILMGALVLEMMIDQQMMIDQLLHESCSHPGFRVFISATPVSEARAHRHFPA